MQSKARGFTLVELLVVIAIIALLIGILLPALGRARDSVRSVVCVTKLRNVGQASLSNALDTDGRLPTSSHSGFGNEPWTVSITGNLAEPVAMADFMSPERTKAATDRWHAFVDEHLRCPLDRFERKPGGFTVYDGTYGLNVYPELTEPELGDGTSSRKRFERLQWIPRPAQTIWAGDRNNDEFPDGSRKGRADHFMAHTWLTGSPVTAATGLHGTGEGYLFFDGHAASAETGEHFDLDSSLDNWNPTTAR